MLQAKAKTAKAARVEAASGKAYYGEFFCLTVDAAAVAAEAHGAARAEARGEDPADSEASAAVTSVVAAEAPSGSIN